MAATDQPAVNPQLAAASRVLDDATLHDLAHRAPAHQARQFRFDAQWRDNPQPRRGHRNVRECNCHGPISQPAGAPAASHIRCPEHTLSKPADLSSGRREKCHLADNSPYTD
jgi:hypothetical protein